MYALSLRRAPLLLARLGTLTSRSGLPSSPGHLAAPLASLSLPQCLPQATLAHLHLRSIHCYRFAWKSSDKDHTNGIEKTKEDEHTTSDKDHTNGIEKIKEDEHTTVSPPLSDDGSKGGGKSGGRIPRFDIWHFLFSVPSLLLTGWVAAKFSGWENEKLEAKKSSTDFQVEQLRRALENTTFNAEEVPDFVPVPSVTKLKKWMRVSEREQIFNLMVCGPRGVGKTTLVKWLLRGERGMMHITLEPSSVDQFYLSILQLLQCKFEGIDQKTLVKQSLSRIRATGGKKPTFVVEVNEKCDTSQMMQLLVEIKTLGSDLKLANFIVVVSTSRAALLIPVTLSELRVSTFYVDDPSEENIHGYIDKRLSVSFPSSTKEERDEFINNYVKALGTRFLDAFALTMTFRVGKAGGKERFEEAKQDGYEFVRRRRNEYHEAYSKFMKMFKNVDQTKKEILLTDLLKGTLQLSNVTDVLPLTEEKFINQMSKLHPHPVYIHPETRQLSMGNYVSTEELKKYMCNNAADS